MKISPISILLVGCIEKKGEIARGFRVVGCGAGYGSVRWRDFWGNRGPRFRELAKSEAKHVSDNVAEVLKFGELNLESDFERVFGVPGCFSV